MSLPAATRSDADCQCCSDGPPPPLRGVAFAREAIAARDATASIAVALGLASSLGASVDAAEELHFVDSPAASTYGARSVLPNEMQLLLLPPPGMVDGDALERRLLRPSSGSALLQHSPLRTSRSVGCPDGGAAPWSPLQVPGSIPCGGAGGGGDPALRSTLATLRAEPHQVATGVEEVEGGPCGSLGAACADEEVASPGWGGRGGAPEPRCGSTDADAACLLKPPLAEPVAAADAAAELPLPPLLPPPAAPRPPPAARPPTLICGEPFCLPEQFGVVEDGVYRGAYPLPASFPFLARLGLRTVVNLLDRREDDYAAFLAAAGVRYVPLPVKGNKVHCEEMDRGRAAEALAVLVDTRCHPVLVHCRSGKHRTGALVGCLRMLQGWSVDAACTEVGGGGGARGGG